MAQSSTSIENIPAASIQYDSHPRGPDDILIHLFRMTADGAEEYFEAAYQFSDNGNDFWVVISNFGLHRKTLAGSRTPLAQKTFKLDAIDAVRNRIQQYFSGHEEKNFSPFSIDRGQLLDVVFAEGWVRGDSASR